MVKLVMMRINLKEISNETLDAIYSAIEGEELIIKRIFDRRFSFSGDDLILEGDLDNFYKKLPEAFTKIVSLKFKLNIGNLQESLSNYSAMSLYNNNLTYFFATALVDYEFIQSKLRLSEKSKIHALLFRSLLGSKFTSIMTVKAKGITVYNNMDNTLSFILPTQRIETLTTWLYAIATSKRVDFDKLVDIFIKTDPQMRRNLDEALNWTSKQLPELVAKATTVSDIDLLKTYDSAFRLFI